jgi:hypothetical protein
MDDDPIDGELELAAVARDQLERPNMLLVLREDLGCRPDSTLRVVSGNAVAKRDPHLVRSHRCLLSSRTSRSYP